MKCFVNICVLPVRLQRLQAITCGQGLSSASLRRVHTTPNTMTNLVLPTPPGPSECLICSELALLVLFSPCQHSVACEGGWRLEAEAGSAMANVDEEADGFLFGVLKDVADSFCCLGIFCLLCSTLTRFLFKQSVPIE